MADVWCGGGVCGVKRKSDDDKFEKCVGSWLIQQMELPCKRLHFHVVQ